MLLYAINQLINFHRNAVNSFLDDASEKEAIGIGILVNVI